MRGESSDVYQYHRDQSFSTLPSTDEEIVQVIDDVANNLSLTHISDSAITTPGPPSSSAALSSTETNDQLAPLSSFADQDRSSVPQNPSGPSRYTIPLPSPILAGISELLAGPSHAPGFNSSYFPPTHPEYPKGSGRSTRHRSISSSRPYHQFVAQEDGSARSTFDPPITPTATDERPPIKAFSDSGLIAKPARAKGSPRIRNTDSALAPHGSFTSSRMRASTNSSRSSPKSSHSAKGAVPRQATTEEMDPVEREQCFIAAAKGDQLAMYRLGYRPTLQHRHSIGEVADVWGPALPSSISSTTTATDTLSLPTIPAKPASTSVQPDDPVPLPEDVPTLSPSDLFADAASLTLRSNARANSSLTDTSHDQF
ncbi:hypothetical protein IAR55_003479 [Kwoniella newhampshirensis]|uniref:Uncharacterized protein n=1 Tax=Kwoniella newhampshirensis TaxID=1651941 RepID=A0AAW0YZF2_9TREE